jgi:hypothetical protein
VNEHCDPFWLWLRQRLLRRLVCRFRDPRRRRNRKVGQGDSSSKHQAGVKPAGPADSRSLVRRWRMVVPSGMPHFEGPSRAWSRTQDSPQLAFGNRAMSAMGRVSRASPVHTVARNCTRDEGRPFGFGDQVVDPKPPRVAAVKSRGGERRGNVGTVIPAGKIERGERKQTASEASKAD